MLLRVTQPILAICNRLGEITDVRILRLTLDIERYEMWDDIKFVGDDTLYTSFKCLSINKIVKKCVYNVSFVDLRRDAKLRSILCNTGGALCGAVNIPVQIVSGEVRNKDLYAVIGSINNGVIVSKPVVYDYTGKEYIWDELLKTNKNIKQHSSKLYCSHTPMQDWYSCECCWINNPACCRQGRRFEYYHKCIDYTVLNEQAVHEYMARRRLMQEQDEGILSGGHITKYTLAQLREGYTYTVPPVCTQVVVKGDAAVKNWRLIGHQDLRYCDMEVVTAPQAVRLEHLYHYVLDAYKSTAPLVLPQLVTAQPWGFGSLFHIEIDDPYKEFDKALDLVPILYDCSDLVLFFGPQPHGRVRIPGAGHIKYAATIDDLTTFVLTIVEKQHKYYTSAKKRGSTFVAAFWISDTSITKQMLFTLQDTDYEEMTLCLDATSCGNAKTNVLINIEKPITTQFYLSTTAMTQVQLCGAGINLLLLRQHPVQNKTGYTHIQAHVKRFLFIYEELRDSATEIFFHGGVDTLAILAVTLDTVNLTKGERARLQEKMSKNLRIHIPKGSKVKGTAVISKGTLVSKYFIHPSHGDKLTEYNFFRRVVDEDGTMYVTDNEIIHRFIYADL